MKSRKTGLMIRVKRSQFVLPVMVWLLICSPGLLLGGENGAGQAAPDRHLIIVSVDGLMPECYTSPASIGLKVPNLVRMKLNGAFAEGVEGVFPSVTYPAHTTMVTGVRPARHGIVFNRIFEPPTDPQTLEWYWFSNVIKSEPLWMLAKKNGMTTAAVGWPVTAGASIDYLMPEIKDPKEEKPTPKRTLQYSTPGLITKALGIGIASDTSIDGRRVAVSEYIIENYKPGLMLIHLIDLDGVQHRYGPRSQAAREMTEREDAYLGRIVEATRKAGIFDKTTFIVVSDHGFAAVQKKFEPNVALAKAKLVTLDAQGRATYWQAFAWGSGGSCAIVLRDRSDKETAAKVTDLFTKIASRGNSPINRVLDQAGIKRLGAVPEAWLMIDAAAGFAFGEELTGPEIHESKDYRGTHGQLPSRAEMRSSLVLYGSGVRAGARAPFARMIDIAPTAAALLGLSFSDIEGAPMRELLKPGIAPAPQPKREAS